MNPAFQAPFAPASDRRVLGRGGLMIAVTQIIVNPETAGPGFGINLRHQADVFQKFGITRTTAVLIYCSGVAGPPCPGQSAVQVFLSNGQLVSVTDGHLNL